MRAFEALMGEENMRSVMGMDINGEGVKAVSIATKQLMMDFEHGLISTDAFVDQVLRFCHPGTTAQQVVDAWMSMLEELPKERLDIVDRVRQNVRNVYLLSNGNDLHFDFINQTYQLAPHFDGLFLSQKMHMAKPETDMYRAVNEQISSGMSEKTNVLFVDDIAANREAAEKTVGWTTFPDIDSVVSYLNL
jgi:putative hydrolase of the HAD superfamily